MDPEPGEARVTWDSPVQFFFTVLGFCVGLGNIWRFPYLCQQNGGGAFILPFLLMLVLVGMPLMLLELGLGQKLRVGAAGAWKKVHPSLGGVGYGSSVVAAIVGSYYNVIIAWCLFYLVSSLQTSLPWASCPLSSPNTTVVECDLSSETQYFWFRKTLDSSDSIDSFGGLKYWNVLCLAASWIIVFLIMMKGIASSGKVVYFTAIFPYIVLTIFFFRGITLKGATAGLAHMFTPKMEMLLKPTVWLDAANQVFYSFGLAFGSIISFGSYNAPTKNCVKDVIIISICNAFTAIYASTVIFSILGFKALHLFEKCMEHDVGILLEKYSEFKDRKVEDIPEEEYFLALAGYSKDHPENSLKNCSLVKELDDSAQGTGFAFIVMADVFTKIPGAPFWSALFFMMLLSLGLGSQIGIMEGLVSTLFDHPRFKKVRKPILTAGVAVGCFLLGLVFTTGAGEYWLTLFDTFGATGLTFIAFTELVSVMYVYGHGRFTRDIHTMTGVRPGPFWQLTWRLISPALMGLIILSSLYFMMSHLPTYTAWDRHTAAGQRKEYPAWTLVIAAILALSSLVPILTVLVAGAVRLGRARQRNKFYRVDTTASTKPMLGEAAADFSQDFPDLPIGAEDSDSDDGGGVVVMPSQQKTAFRLEVVE